jgi:hypothetical protein
MGNNSKEKINLGKHRMRGALDESFGQNSIFTNTHFRNVFRSISLYACILIVSKLKSRFSNFLTAVTYKPTPNKILEHERFRLTRFAYCNGHARPARNGLG